MLNKLETHHFDDCDVNATHFLNGKRLWRRYFWCFRLRHMKKGHLLVPKFKRNPSKIFMWKV